VEVDVISEAAHVEARLRELGRIRNAGRRMVSEAEARV
jgi:hypothetical protein